MGTNKTTPGLVAAATTSNKTVNQDAYAVVRDGKATLGALIVADGLGSHFRSEVASAIVVATLQQALEQAESLGEIDIPRLFFDARGHLERHVKERAEELPANLDWKNAFGTTVLCAVETNDHIMLGYLGNGAIFHLRGNFNTFPPSQLLPWTAVNYLNPHSFSQGGKNVLYKLLSISSAPIEMAPTVLTVRKDSELFGDIVMICSDGIYSYDQVPMGKDSEEHIWISGEETLAVFFEHLKRFFAEREYTEQALQASLEEFLAQLRARTLISDDCTLGVLITERALRYQQGLRSESNKET